MRRGHGAWTLRREPGRRGVADAWSSQQGPRPTHGLWGGEGTALRAGRVQSQGGASWCWRGWPGCGAPARPPRGSCAGAHAWQGVAAPHGARLGRGRRTRHGEGRPPGAWVWGSLGEGVALTVVPRVGEAASGHGADGAGVVCLQGLLPLQLPVDPPPDPRQVQLPVELAGGQRDAVGRDRARPPWVRPRPPRGTPDPSSCWRASGGGPRAPGSRRWALGELTGLTRSLHRPCLPPGPAPRGRPLPAPARPPGEWPAGAGTAGRGALTCPGRAALSRGTGRTRGGGRRS